MFGDQSTTHYVAIAYQLQLDKLLKNLPLDIQHGSYQWIKFKDLLENEEVHEHTMRYFGEYIVGIY